MQRNLFYRRMLILACVLCNISQLPLLFDNQIINIAYMGTWIFLALLMTKNERTIDIDNIVLPIIFDLYCVLLYFFTDGYISSNLFRPINLCTFIMLIGVWAGNYLNENDLKIISGAFILSSLVVAAYLYFNIFRGVDWADTGAYLYGSKNSAGQIFLTAIILIVLFYVKEYKTVSMVLVIFLASLIVMMKSRATLLTLVLVSIYIVIFIIEKPVYKMFGILVILAIGILIFTNKSLYNLYINQIMLNNRAVDDISGITSNRDVQYDYFIQNFKQYWYTGTGGTYLESMPLAVLLSYGILGGIPVLLFSIYPLYIGIVNFGNPKYRAFCSSIMTLGLVMWVNGIFEEQSPFGPGVKCYFLWLVTGLFLGYKKRMKQYGRDY